jgi:hypothetical protein
LPGYAPNRNCVAFAGTAPAALPKPREGVVELQPFARGLQGDYAAARAGLSMVWSNGQTEGQIHRLKTAAVQCPHLAFRELACVLFSLMFSLEA